MRIVRNDALKVSEKRFVSSSEVRTNFQRFPPARVQHEACGGGRKSCRRVRGPIITVRQLLSILCQAGGAAAAVAQINVVRCGKLTCGSQDGAGSRKKTFITIKGGEPAGLADGWWVLL